MKANILNRIKTQKKIKLSKEELLFVKSETSFLPDNISLPERLWYWTTKTNKIVKCESCGGKVSWSKTIKSYVKYCHKCNISSKETRLKTKQTNLNKYGYENVFSSPDIINKIEATKLTTYGNKTYNNRKKFKTTCKLLYGKSSYTQTLEYFKRTVKIALSNKDIELLYMKVNNNAWLLEELKTKSCSMIAHELGIASKSIIRRAKVLGISIRPNTSELELSVYKFVKSLTKDATTNNRKVIYPFEIDVYSESDKFGIEVNGLYWHNHNRLRDKKYHLNKTTLCYSKSISLFHIFENEWLDTTKRAIWKSIISNKLGHSNRLYARHCDIRLVNYKDKNIYLTKNHLQGDCPSSVNIGLYYEDELVSLMTFGKSRFNKKYDWELLRFCNKLNMVVVGGASKLFKNFLHNHTGNIISYADIRRSAGNLYEKLGFTHIHNTNPNYWYFKNNSLLLESRIKYQKHKLHSLFDNYDKRLTESENMHNNGYMRIYDCGNQVWIYER